MLKMLMLGTAMGVAIGIWTVSVFEKRTFRSGLLSLACGVEGRAGVVLYDYEADEEAWVCVDVRDAYPQSNALDRVIKRIEAAHQEQ